MRTDRILVFAEICALFLLHSPSSGQELDISTAPLILAQEKTIKTGDIAIISPIKGTPSAYDTYDILSPFDGRIDEVMVELFDKVDTKSVMCKMATKDMAAILDTANAADPESKKDILKRWKGTFDYYAVKPDDPGIVTNIFIKPGVYVNKGERIFTIARRMQIIATNTEPIYSQITPGIKAIMSWMKDEAVSVELTLKNFVPMKNNNFFYRLWLEVDQLRDRIKVGELFSGTLKIGKSNNTKLIPRSEVLRFNGKSYVIMEVKTGLISAEEVEILSPTMNYIRPERAPGIMTEHQTISPGKKEVRKNGKNKARE